ncbi:MAG: thermonuclease family protein [Candidatus Curtissbacteria bacterium]|nr:thermonuclease family protein [Candidatus Curtissbacteria bacterium]
MKKFVPLFFSGLFIIFGLLLITFPFEKNRAGLESTLTKNQPQVASASDSSQLSREIKNTQEAKVARVIDGDTIELEDGQRVRYIGIDTPETVDPRKPVQCFGREASNKNKELVESKTVRLEKDVSETDKYGRFLRYVYVEDAFVNDFLVRQGFAHSSSYPPDIKHQQQFQQAEKEAQENNRGLWAGCNSPSTPTTQATPSQQAPDPNCVIKGNISSTGEKIYHMPGQNYYNKTRIDTSKGEKWFCTEDEAVAAGWRKSKL